MPSFVTPKKNAAFTFYLSLASQANQKIFQVNPTLAAGDVKVSTDGGAEANITTLPVVTPAGSRRLKVDLSAGEMNGDNVQVTFSDAAGSEWCDVTVNIQTSARQVDDLLPTASYTAPDNATVALIAGYTDSIEGRLPAALVGGRMDSSVGADALGLATAATQTTILARLGAFTGSGLNTVLGFLRAMFNKAAGLTPSDLVSGGLTGDNTTDSTEAIRDRGDAAWGSAGSDPLVNPVPGTYAAGTAGAALGRIGAVGQIVLADQTSSSSITRRRGDSWSIQLTGLGSIADRTKLWCTIKSDRGLTDANATVQIVVSNPGVGTDGLVVLNRVVAATLANGSITVDDAALGNITIALDEVETALLAAGGYQFDVQVRRSTGAVSSLAEGSFTITEDVTRATS